LSSWKLALDAAGKSPKTISSYLDCAKRLEAYLTTEGLPLEPRRHRAFLIAERERSPSDWARHGHDYKRFQDRSWCIQL
jgi:hypothetical protein